MADIPGDLAGELDRLYGLRGRAHEIAPGLSASTMWRVDSVPPVMVRISERWPPPDQVRRSCAVATAFARVIPQVPTPLSAFDGTTVSLWRESPVVVWPFIDGHCLNPDDRAQRLLAAQLLAELHCAALNVDGPGPDPSASTYATRSADPNPAGVPADPELDEWRHRWRQNRRQQAPHGWMHGNFFHGNILCRNGNVTGLIDWDDAQYGPLITELASATWEFACTPERDNLAPGSAHEFLNAYARAGGPVHITQDIVPLIRLRLRSSVAFFRRLQTYGHVLDQANERASIAAFTALRHFVVTQ